MVFTESTNAHLVVSDMKEGFQSILCVTWLTNGSGTGHGPEQLVFLERDQREQSRWLCYMGVVQGGGHTEFGLISLVYLTGKHPFYPFLASSMAPVCLHILSLYYALIHVSNSRSKYDV